MRLTIKKAASLVLALAVVVTFVAAMSGSVLAKQPPGQKGHQGQPGIQGGASGQPGGPSGNPQKP